MLPVYYILFGRILIPVSLSFAISHWLLSVVEGIFKTPPLWWFAGVSRGLSDPTLVIEKTITFAILRYTSIKPTLRIQPS